MGVWGMPPEENFRATPSRTLEIAPLEQEMKVAFIIDLCAKVKNRSFNLEKKDEQAMLTNPFPVLCF